MVSAHGVAWEVRSVGPVFLVDEDIYGNVTPSVCRKSLRVIN